jgi:SIT4-associating protein SAP185/190
MGPRAAVLNAVNAAQGFNSGSSALTNAGLNGGGGAGLDSMDLSNNPGFLSGGSLLSGFGSSSDEEDEDMEEMGGDGEAGNEAVRSSLSFEDVDMRDA